MSGNSEAADKKFGEVYPAMECDFDSCYEWAKEALKEHEGSGHIFNFYVSGGKIGCCFSKPSWGGEHTSTKLQDFGCAAIVMSVCEYLHGF